MPDPAPSPAAQVASLLADDPVRLPLLRAVAALELPDGWIAAGCVRNAVWDHLHGRPPSPPHGDVDVVWHDASRTDPALDRAIEATLRLSHAFDWSVKNQARMHFRANDPPYASTADAMRHWPETATAVAARWAGNAVEILAPHGLEDLFALTLRPGPAWTGSRRPAYEARIAAKRWIDRWPGLTLA